MDRVGPGATTSADVQVFALSAFALVGLEVPQVIENLRIFPDFPEGCLLDIAGGAVEIRTGLDVSKTVDQTDGLGGDATLAAAGGEGQ